MSLRTYTSAVTASDVESRKESLAASIENLIADFIPNEHKDVPKAIAKAVIAELFPYHHDYSDPY